MGREQLTLNLTPSWKTAISFYIEWLQTGTESQKELAKSDLLRLAEELDSEEE